MVNNLTKMNTDKKFFKQAIKQARISMEKGGFPAGAVLVKDGKIIAVFPVTVGVVGLLFAPALAAIGAIAALVTECSITVERTL